MAKVTITLQDTDEGDATLSVKLSVRFDPPVDAENVDELTDAQAMGARLLYAAKMNSERWEKDDE